MEALQDCFSSSNYSAHFFVPNSLAEWQSVTARLANSSEYWFGLQNYAKRGVGDLTSMGPVDPDDEWFWMDWRQTETVKYSEMTLVSTDTYSFPALDGGVYWKGELSSDHFAAFITTDTPRAMSGSKKFLEPRRYICETAQLCITCPSGYYRYNDLCFLYTGPAKFVLAKSARETAGAKMLSPKNDALAILSKLIANQFVPSGKPMHIGLEKMLLMCGVGVTLWTRFYTLTPSK